VVAAVKYVVVANHRQSKTEKILTGSNSHTCHSDMSAIQLTAAQLEALKAAAVHPPPPGFQQQHAEVLQRITDAPVAIQFYPERILGKMINDSHYRNAFETGSSTGSSSLKSRKEWEDTLFGGSYATATAGERVKYGYLAGFSSVRLTYGDSLLVLKEHVKNRCTVTVGDSSNPTSKPYLLSDPISLLHDSKCTYNSKGWSFAWGYDTYLEAQVHGSIHLSSDVEKLVLDEKYSCNKQIIAYAKAFTKKHSCPVEFARIR